MGSIKHFILSVLVSFFALETQAGDSITIYIFLLDECRICQEISPELNSIYDTYKNKYSFCGIFPNFSSKQKGIDKFKEKYKIRFYTKTDYFKTLTHKFKASVLPEVVIWNETTKQIEYRGAVNDLFVTPGKRRSSAQNHYLEDALEALNKGERPAIQQTDPIGCYINLNDSFN